MAEILPSRRGSVLIPGAVCVGSDLFPENLAMSIRIQKNATLHEPAALRPLSDPAAIRASLIAVGVLVPASAKPKHAALAHCRGTITVPLDAAGIRAAAHAICAHFRRDLDAITRQADPRVADELRRLQVAHQQAAA